MQPSLGTFPPSLMPIAARPAPVMVRGAGSWLWDEAGRRYLDLVQGWAVNCLGHAPPELQHALAHQAAQLWNASPGYHTAAQRDYANALIATCELDRVFFCNSGAEANEGAIKLARKWGQRRRAGAATIITTDRSFHGRTLATMAASGKPGFADRFPPRIPGFMHVPYDDPGAVAAAIDRDTVAVMVEPIQGEAGVVVPGDGYLAALRTLCDDAGVLLILDEIQTGMGRTGPLFAHQATGVVPDIMTLGKGLGGGAPLAALLCRESVSCFEPGDQGGTFNGNPLMCAVGAAVLAALTEPAAVARRSAQAGRLRASLERLLDGGHVTHVRGAGHLLAAVLSEPRADGVRDACLARGLLVNAPSPTCLRVMPALNITGDEVDTAISILTEVLARA